MLVETTISVTTLLNWAKITSAVVTAFSLLFGVFKVINWIKGKFVSINENVVELKTMMTENMTGLREDIKNQTTTLASELREQRQDFRTFYAPYIVQSMQASMPQQQPLLAKAKRTSPKKKPTK